MTLYSLDRKYSIVVCPKILERLVDILFTFSKCSLEKLDRSLPYTEAVLLESMRIHTIAPFTVAHCALRDTQLQGYTIPKVTVHSAFIYLH